MRSIHLGYRGDQPLTSFGDQVADTCSVSLEGRDSSYLGEYLLYRDDDVKIRIRINSDPFYEEGDPDEERFAFPEYQKSNLVVEIDGSKPQVSQFANLLLASISDLHHEKTDDA